ncbi:probable DNA mismatch repair protein MSH6 [Zygosaccharomyces bailii]|nr:probable DNA mismatch repair protein MSH6 [Zygosaccharomyces bailii]
MVASTPKGPSSAQKKMKQSTLLSFFSKQQSTPSPTAKKSNPLKDIKTTPTQISKSPEEKKHKNRLLFVGMEDDESFVTANDSVTVYDEKCEETQNFAKEPEDCSKETSKVGDDDENDMPFKRRRRNVSYTEDEDEDDEDGTQSSKRSKYLSDDEDAYVPKHQSDAASDSLDDGDDVDDDEILSLADRPKKKQNKELMKTKSSSLGRTPARKPNSRTSSPPKHSAFNKQNEERYHWLVDERDAQRRPKDDPEYDQRTLYIPSSAWAKFTPFEKQYWEIKAAMWDCIVFFKKGKFFELYEKDAALANHLFDWKIAGGGRANMQLAGIPEMSFDYWAAQFIQYGYKVAKVDQRESMLAKEIREGSKGIVKRELQCVLTSGTLTDGNMLQSDLATYCLAVREDVGDLYNVENNLDHAESAPQRIFGVAFIDTSTGELELMEFEDDNECTKLDTIMSQLNPKEIIMEKNNLSNLAHKVVKFNAAPNAIFNYVKSLEEFYDFEKTFDELVSKENNYFPDMDRWPPVLKKYYEKGKKVGFSAFGGLLHYLQWLKLDKNLISIGNIKEYNPIKSQNSLVLDGVTLQNLEIFSNSFDGSDKGTLFKLFNKAITPMGKRMMKKWLMHPLLHKSDIDGRLDTIDCLLSDTALRDLLESAFSKLPDLERLVARTHSGNLNVANFDKVIKGFETIAALIRELSDYTLKGSVSNYVASIPGSLFEKIDNWANAFDRTKAVHEGILIPHRDVDPDFDKSLDRISDLENVLDDWLLKYRKQFKCSNVQYKDSGKEIYLIEVPISATKYVPSSWMQMGANKNFKRYYSDEVKQLARSVAEARELHKSLEEDLKNRLCRKFDTDYEACWLPTIHAVSNIDCLLALVRTSESLGFPSCRPELIENDETERGLSQNGFLKFTSLRHPCFNLGTMNHKEFIPNDVKLGKDFPQIGLLTGANAAGKSTILRMTCIAVIMAQMGCYVPCESAVMTPMDKIMTRLGANDNIMQGKSTFFVELSETKKILDLATNRSLLVVDELGRGGSSSDGFAIAEAVLHHVATHTQSLGFFATHYATLGLSFKYHSMVRPMRMSILVDEETRNVTFLYKLEDGQSEGSFGMHVASMCGIPKQVVESARNAADTLEHTSKMIKQRKLATEEVQGLVPLGLQSDFARMVYGNGLNNSKLGTGENAMIYDSNVKRNVLDIIFGIVDKLD